MHYPKLLEEIVLCSLKKFKAGGQVQGEVQEDEISAKSLRKFSDGITKWEPRAYMMSYFLLRKSKSEVKQ